MLKSHELQSIQIFHTLHNEAMYLNSAMQKLTFLETDTQTAYVSW
jgi:hypothetical protein